MNNQATLDCMQKMKLEGMANSYKAIIDLPADQHPTTHECIATLVDAELHNRAHKKTNMLLRLSKLSEIVMIKSDSFNNLVLKLKTIKNRFHHDYTRQSY